MTFLENVVVDYPRVQKLTLSSNKKNSQDHDCRPFIESYYTDLLCGLAITAHQESEHLQFAFEWNEDNELLCGTFFLTRLIREPEYYDTAPIAFQKGYRNEFKRQINTVTRLGEPGIKKYIERVFNNVLNKLEFESAQ